MQTVARAAKIQVSPVLNFVLPCVAATLAISLLAQVAIPLPFTPVPLTGQTFGVLLAALLLGRKRALGTMSLYLSLGAAGLPVFAPTAAGPLLGPTFGYLVGMMAAAWFVGGLADRGATQTFARAWGATFAGSILIFAFGLVGLSFFVPEKQLLSLGLLPFLPGDVIKVTLAASMGRQFGR